MLICTLLIRSNFIIFVSFVFMFICLFAIFHTSIAYHDFLYLRDICALNRPMSVKVPVLATIVSRNLCALCAIILRLITFCFLNVNIYVHFLSFDYYFVLCVGVLSFREMSLLLCSLLQTLSFFNRTLCLLVWYVFGLS